MPFSFLQMMWLFFLGKPDAGVPQVGEHTTNEEVGDQVEEPEGFEEEDPYNMCVQDQIYDTVDENATYIPDILNRPPAPIPRPVTFSEPEESKTYISRGRWLKCSLNILASA